jgi:hypothetical protein
LTSKNIAHQQLSRHGTTRQDRRVVVNALKGLFVAALVERERERTWRTAEEEREAKDGMLWPVRPTYHSSSGGKVR